MTVDNSMNIFGPSKCSISVCSDETDQTASSITSASSVMLYIMVSHSSICSSNSSLVLNWTIDKTWIESRHIATMHYSRYNLEKCSPNIYVMINNVISISMLRHIRPTLFSVRQLHVVWKDGVGILIGYVLLNNSEVTVLPRLIYGIAYRLLTSVTYHNWHCCCLWLSGWYHLLDWIGQAPNTSMSLVIGVVVRSTRGRERILLVVIAGLP